MTTHEHVSSHPGGLFCICGKVVDKAGLRNVGVHGFSGGQTMSPRVERFLDTGEPAVLKDSWPLDRPVEEMPDRSKNPARTTYYEAPAFSEVPEKTLAAQRGWHAD